VDFLEAPFLMWSIGGNNERKITERLLVARNLAVPINREDEGPDYLTLQMPHWYVILVPQLQ
jgi:hypothetical protein